MIYLDTNALVKLVREEAESEALLAWLDERPAEPVVSSELAVTEVARVVRRNNHDDQGRPFDPAALAEDLTAADELLDALGLLVLDRDVLVRAGRLGDPMVRSLDAIHLASALGLFADQLSFVSYDRRLAAAARESGLTVVAPG